MISLQRHEVGLQIPNEGSLVLVIALIGLQGVTGISFGLVISSAIDDEQNANQAALGIFYPNLIVSGIIWPVECIPYPLRYISLALPQTYASEALRCIMYRGWGLSRMMVVARLRCHLGLEHFLPHPGHRHPQAEDLRRLPGGAS
nr:ABC transporter G family member 20-like [Salvelinus alpinus]